LSAETRLATLILVFLVASNLAMSPLASASAKSRSAVRRERALWSASSPNLDLTRTASQQDKEQEDDNKTRVRAGRRLRKGDLPRTGPTLAPWLIPLVMGGLGLMSVGITLLVRLNELRDEMYLVGMERKRVMSASYEPASRKAPLGSGQQRSEWQVKGDEGSVGRRNIASRESRPVAEAWKAMGHKSQLRPIRVHLHPW
jgi:hypothetical protein